MARNTKDCNSTNRSTQTNCRTNTKKAGEATQTTQSTQNTRNKTGSQNKK